MKAWFLIVLFHTTDDAKIAVFETQKDCEIQKGITVAAIGNHKEVKSIECIAGEFKGEDEK